MLTVVSVAPQGVSGAHCGTSAFDYYLAVRDSATEDLDHARAQLRAFGVRAAYELLIDRVRGWTHSPRPGHFDLVLLPARRRPM